MTIPSPRLTLSGRRFSALYELTCPPDEAERRALEVAVEQTIEFPLEAVPDGDIRREIVGRVESIELARTPGSNGSNGNNGAASRQRHRVRISYADELLGGEMTQLANVLFGNVALKPGVRLLELDPSPGALACGPGPRYGIAGLRELVGDPAVDRPLIASAIKPIGLPPSALADMAAAYAMGGVDIIKDDHGLTDQPFCRFDERVGRCVEAVGRASASTGRKTLYFANVTAPGSRTLQRAHEARRLGADGVMVAPGLVGLDAMAELAADDSLGLPVLAHPSWYGHMSGGATHGRGIAHRVLYGQMLRIAGADASIFACHGGRFAESEAQSREVCEGCRAPLSGLPPIFPAAAGGIRLQRLEELVDFFGNDVVLLVGGALHTDRDDLAQSCAAFRRAVERLLV